MNSKKQLIIAAAGHIGAGKETFFGVLRNLLGEKQLNHVRTNLPVKNVLNALNVPINRVNLQGVVRCLESWREGVLCEAVKAEIKKCAAPVIYLDCLRLKTDIQMIYELEREGYLVFVVAISADQRVRWQRCQKRASSRMHGKSDEASVSFSEFQEREKEFTELAIEELMNSASICIFNNGSILGFAQDAKTALMDSAGNLLIQVLP